LGTTLIAGFGYMSPGPLIGVEIAGTGAGAASAGNGMTLTRHAPTVTANRPVFMESFLSPA
jgi:hypothetical protein